MSNIQKAFENKKAFVTFLTAGDPSIDKTYEYILEMDKAGADMIEIGIPFSDPISEGPIIQAANVRALEKGCTTDDVFEMVQKVRKVTNIPLVFMAYLNQVFKYGTERFFERCKDTGVDGIIIPDMPYEEKGEVREIAQKCEVDVITLIAPTSKERIQMIAKEATGFIYVLSSKGSVIQRKDVKVSAKEIISVIKEVTDVPVMVSEDIEKREQVVALHEYADGVIDGSSIVKMIAQNGAEAGNVIRNYVTEMTMK